MAKNFNNANSAKTFATVSKVSAEKSQIMFIQMIDNVYLIDNPNNGEDLLYTVDLENSMKQLGFTDPIEITDFGMPKGQYMILSGHRRRKAGTNIGLTCFPCIMRNFKDVDDIQNYTLLSNSQRDSAKDPFLFTKRYKLHENYLSEIGFKGSKREEISKRLGLSVQQCDRYNVFNRIILPIWDLVRGEFVGMSSVQSLGTHTECEQGEILLVMQEVLNSDKLLTRDVMKVIIDGYRSGKRTWVEMDTSLVIVDVIDESLPIIEDVVDISSQTKSSLSVDEKNLKQVDDIIKSFSKFESSLQEIFHCKDNVRAKEFVGLMSNACFNIIDEMFTLTNEKEMTMDFIEVINKLKVKLDEYK